ncbi:hypothetical protein EW146_g8795 [Bondarzewia mesenterica]|uniref:Protein CPL1-like domain-containing protein n=1 Tax=Bondarzewia mesenterica TaxID=1095465 RepID=A0A4S4LBJ4_9AGAM|nr:hypothetical protein EW146_g8795 [Bondarzewia mesenterica]
MRLLHLLPTLFLVFARPDAVAAQAHQNDLRALVDVCASIDADLDVPNPFGGNALVIGKLDLCLCLSAIPQFLTANVLAIAAVAIAGKPVVTAALEALFRSMTLPANRNAPIPRMRSLLALAPPAVLLAPMVSPPRLPRTLPPASAKPPTPSVMASAATSHPALLASPSPNARRGGRAAVPAGAKARVGWLAASLAVLLGPGSGGCALPLTPYTPMGTDCTAIPGIADVSCQSGSCVVHRCLPGYVKAPNGSECIRKHSGSKHHVAIEEWDEEDMRAMRYGLEHVPLDH